MLERTYDNLFRIWLQDGGAIPVESTSDQLRISYSGTLNPIKSLRLKKFLNLMRKLKQ